MASEAPIVSGIGRWNDADASDLSADGKARRRVTASLRRRGSEQYERGGFCGPVRRPLFKGERQAAFLAALSKQTGASTLLTR